MREFTLRHIDGAVTVVRAETERVARDLAMFHRWGAPDGRVLLQRPYAGRGLTLDQFVDRPAAPRCNT